MANKSEYHAQNQSDLWGCWQERPLGQVDHRVVGLGNGKKAAEGPGTLASLMATDHMGPLASDRAGSQQRFAAVQFTEHHQELMRLLSASRAIPADLRDRWRWQVSRHPFPVLALALCRSGPDDPEGVAALAQLLAAARWAIGDVLKDHQRALRQRRPALIEIIQNIRFGQQMGAVQLELECLKILLDHTQEVTGSALEVQGDNNGPIR